MISESELEQILDGTTQLHAFLWCLVIIRIVSAPAQDLYWSKDNLFHLSCIEERFTRKRFINIQRFFANMIQNPPRNLTVHKKLVHVWTVMEIIWENFKQQYNTHKEVSIDKVMTTFSGQPGFKQHVPLKPTKHGIKVWVCADPHNGFKNDFQVYTVKEGNLPEANLSWIWWTRWFVIVSYHPQICFWSCGLRKLCLWQSEIQQKRNAKWLG